MTVFVYVYIVIYLEISACDHISEHYCITWTLSMGNIMFYFKIVTNVAWLHVCGKIPEEEWH